MLPLVEKLFTNYISARKTFLEQITESDSRKFDSGIGDFSYGSSQGHVLDGWPVLDISGFHQDFGNF